WRSKLALLTERFRRPRRDPADESVEAFARRRTTDEIARTLADAFVTGIHAGDPALLSVRAAFPRLAAFEREYGSVTRGVAAAARERGAEARGRSDGQESRDGVHASESRGPRPPAGCHGSLSRANRHNSEGRASPRTWSFREGMGLLISTLAERLRRPPL